MNEEQVFFSSKPQSNLDFYHNIARKAFIPKRQKFWNYLLHGTSKSTLRKFYHWYLTNTLFVPEISFKNKFTAKLPFCRTPWMAAIFITYDRVPDILHIKYLTDFTKKSCILKRNPRWPSQIRAHNIADTFVAKSGAAAIVSQRWIMWCLL